MKGVTVEIGLKKMEAGEEGTQRMKSINSRCY